MERGLGGVVCIMVELKLIVRSFAAACVVCQYSLTNCLNCTSRIGTFHVLCCFFGPEGLRRDRVIAKAMAGPQRAH